MTTTQNIDKQISAVLERLHLATIGAAMRTQMQLTDGLEELDRQSIRQKGNLWLNQTAWLVDTLKHHAMDGLDITLIVGEEDLSTVRNRQLKLKQTGIYARNALFSAASPLQCARNFFTHVEPFTSICSGIASQLETLVDKNTNPEQDSIASLYRTKPEQGQGLPGPGDGK